VRLNRLVSLTLVALAASCGLAATPSLAATSLSGAGSTLAAPLVAEWAAAFEAFHGTTVSYDAAGSQAGINAISSRTVDFASSDAPLTSSQASSCSNCFQIPWSLTAVGIGYHIHGIGRSLYLTGAVLAQIYLGQISRWNDARIKALNPRAALPSLAITPIYSSTSGDTYTFTSYLSKVSAAWRNRVGAGLTVSFPTGTPAKTTSDATALLGATNGAVAYLGAAFLIANRLPAAAIQNAAGRFEYPNLSDIESAGRTVKHVPVGNALQIVDPPASAKTAYPISTFTYVIVPANAGKRSTLAQWISYAIGSGQEFGPALDYAALPSVVERASKATLTLFENAH
jgi:phosphate transport system substrate-binding protein